MHLQSLTSDISFASVNVCWRMVVGSPNAKRHLSIYIHILYMRIMPLLYYIMCIYILYIYILYMMKYCNILWVCVEDPGVKFAIVSMNWFSLGESETMDRCCKPVVLKLLQLETDTIFTFSFADRHHLCIFFHLALMVSALSKTGDQSLKQWSQTFWAVDPCCC